jgi:peptide/nickel transport system permease protein
LAVGVIATLLAAVIGITVGMTSGYRGGLTDLLTMRTVEILVCFPSFLLLLILMGMLKDYKFDQSALVVIAVIALTGWMGLAMLVRGETLKLREMAFMQSCRVAGCGFWRTYFVNLLPNLMTPVMVSFTFAVAGAILAEASLSFLGFGVQPPTPSWGEMLRQAFADPFYYRHLAIVPGAALFIVTAGFNLIGEGLRKTLPK